MALRHLRFEMARINGSEAIRIGNRMFCTSCKMKGQAQIKGVGMEPGIITRGNVEKCPQNVLCHIDG
jgi:hypothetical protein